MKPSILLSLLLVLVFLLSFYTTTEAQKLIYNSCKTISKQNPNINLGFCTTSLQAAPASRCANLTGLGNISFQLIRYNLTDTKCQVRQLKMNQRLDPFEKRCLEDCFELYSDAIQAIKKASDYFKTKRYIDADTEISSVMEAATTCEDGFKEKKGYVSPLTKRNNYTFELSAMALSIMQMINSTKLEFSNMSSQLCV